MANWIIIAEEAHSYKNVSAFTKFLYGSRHIVRKMVAARAYWRRAIHRKELT